VIWYDYPATIFFKKRTQLMNIRKFLDIVINKESHHVFVLFLARAKIGRALLLGFTAEPERAAEAVVDV
jgi:hypothetical protein